MNWGWRVGLPGIRETDSGERRLSWRRDPSEREAWS